MCSDEFVNAQNFGHQIILMKCVLTLIGQVCCCNLLSEIVSFCIRCPEVIDLCPLKHSHIVINFVTAHFMGKSVGYQIVYPNGCKELTDTLKVDELRRRLNVSWWNNVISS